VRSRLLYWIVTGALLGAGMAVARAIDPASPIAVLLLVLFVLWVIVSAIMLFWLVWRWATYRVSVRLFLSYLLIGVSPFLFCGAFAAVSLYILMGQYTSVRCGNMLDRQLAVVRGRCESLLETARVEGAETALARIRDIDGVGVGGFPTVLWMADLDERSEFRSEAAADLPEPSWPGPGVAESVVRHGEAVYAMVSVTGEDRTQRVTALVPLDTSTARAIGRDAWFQVHFAVTDDDPSTRDDEVQLGASVDESGIRIDMQSSEGDEDALFGPWQSDGESWWHRPYVLWFRLARDVRDLGTGEAREEPSFVSLLRTSPARVWDDFVLSRYELSTGLRSALVGMGVFFVVLYGIALLMAGTMIVFITRSTARLTRGAREVERGHLDYRVKVRRRDQLGDLGLAFNRMTESVQDMLRQVADRERLARELELAREIQESLLPDRHLRHGPFTVHATFRPAAEVGGDYFDIFPLSEDRLVVVTGDVAGHGLHTGLLMASLKSSVAALVHEGYTGPELVDRVNRLVIEHGAGRTMASLGVVEIDPVARRLHLTNAGHPPPFLLTSQGSEELMVGSLPIGSPLCEPAELERPFPADSLLVLYSDGLVEAPDSSGEPFGYQRLAEMLDECRQLGGGELSAAVLGALERHLGGRELADDLTLVVVESGGVDGGGERSND
jgi:serine phosphatase RsbU (regulator of sigma subunit)